MNDDDDFITDLEDVLMRHDPDMNQLCRVFFSLIALCASRDFEKEIAMKGLSKFLFTAIDYAYEAQEGMED